MKLEMVEMTSEEEERINKKRIELEEKEQIIIKDRRELIEQKQQNHDTYACFLS